MPPWSGPGSVSTCSVAPRRLRDDRASRPAAHAGSAARLRLRHAGGERHRADRDLPAGVDGVELPAPPGPADALAGAPVCRSRQLCGARARPALLVVARTHAVFHRRHRVAGARARAGDRAGDEQRISRPGIRARDLASPVGDSHRRRGAALALHVRLASRHRERTARRHRCDRAADGVVHRSDHGVDSGDSLRCLEDHALRGDPPARRTPEHRPQSVRGGGGRRSQRVVAALAHHDSSPQADDLRRTDLPHTRRISRVRPALCTHGRGTRHGDRADRAVYAHDHPPAPAIRVRVGAFRRGIHHHVRVGADLHTRAGTSFERGRAMTARAERPWLRTLVVVALLIPIAFPLYWALVASLTSEAALFSDPSLWPTDPILSHYRALFANRDFWTPVRNSLVVAGVTTLFCVTVGALAAYALARLEFRGKALILGFILAVSMFPQISIVSPLYLLLRSMRLINTYPGLIMPYMTFAMPLTVWLLVGYFRQLPKDLEEAALVDGASRLVAFVKIIIPLAMPGLATTAILTFIYCWNEFLFALSFTLGPERQTVPVAIALFRGEYQVPWGEILAASVIATAPVAAIVLIFQRRIVQGLTSGAVKG